MLTNNNRKKRIKMRDYDQNSSGHNHIGISWNNDFISLVYNIMPAFMFYVKILNVNKI